MLQIIAWNATLSLFQSTKCAASIFFLEAFATTQQQKTTNYNFSDVLCCVFPILSVLIRKIIHNKEIQDE